jgi:hypothetical protein
LALRHFVAAPSALKAHISGHVCAYACIDITACIPDRRTKPTHIPCCPHSPPRRWQLQVAGKKEETVCRFCEQALPDWRDSLTPMTYQPTVPVMLVRFEGRSFKLRVYPGPEGLTMFKQQVREASQGCTRLAEWEWDATATTAYSSTVKCSSASAVFLTFKQCSLSS